MSLYPFVPSLLTDKWRRRPSAFTAANGSQTGFARMFEGASKVAKLSSTDACLRLRASPSGPRYRGAASLSQPPQHRAHGGLCRAVTDAVQELLAGVKSTTTTPSRWKYVFAVTSRPCSQFLKDTPATTAGAQSQLPWREQGTRVMCNPCTNVQNFRTKNGEERMTRATLFITLLFTTLAIIPVAV